jgi:SAM-dependent methyltransferase
MFTTGRLAQAFDAVGRWLDAGEEAAVMLVAGECRGKPILDIGVGAGRTTSLLALLSDDYTALDYSQTLVDRALRAHPGIDIRQGDARDLSAYPRGHYGLVVFSYNGIDNVNHEDRATVLGQIHEALAPGGYFVYCTLNKRGPWFGTPPWQLGRSSPSQSFVRHWVRTAADVLLHQGQFRQDCQTFRQLRDQFEDFGDWGLGPLSGPGIGLIQHWTTPPATALELRQAGLEPVALFNPDGSPIAGTTGDGSGGMFHVVAQRPLGHADPG